MVEVRPELLLAAELRPLGEEIQVVVAQDAPEAVGVQHVADHAALPRDAEAVVEPHRVGAPARHGRFEDPAIPAPRHRQRLVSRERNQIDGRRLRQERAHHEAAALALDRVRAEDGEGVAVRTPLEAEGGSVQG
jgi:hypothetical protein